MRKQDRKYLKTVSQLEDMLKFSRMHKIKLDEFLKANPDVDIKNDPVWKLEYVIYRRYHLFIVVYKKGDIPIDCLVIAPDNISYNHIIFTFVQLTDWKKLEDIEKEDSDSNLSCN